MINSMAKTCAFTIVAKNYIGLGLILGESIKKHNTDIDFKIVVADEFDHTPDNLPDEVVFAKDILKWSNNRWIKMTFQYDLTQFCTAIKPGSLLHFMNMGYDKVLYFDPDIFIFSSLDEILSALDKFLIILTPQIAGIHIKYNGEHPEWAMNCNGIFNLGFGGYRNSPKVISILKWWDKRLETECFSDRTVGNFTDQKWMDWIPGFLNANEFSSMSSLGMNMAPWNFFERKILSDKGTLFVTYRDKDQIVQRKDKLVFIHFAGYDYSALKRGEIKRKRIEGLKEYEDLYMAVSLYRNAIVENSQTFDMFIQQPYSYATYDNGDLIEPFHRRLFHGLLMEGQENINPFLTCKGSFYKEIKDKKIYDRTHSTMNLSRSNVGDVSSKRRLIGIIFSTIKKIGGYKRYVPFTKAMIDYCRPEFHTFLLNKKNITK